MSKLNSRPIKDNILNLKVKSQLNEKKIKKIRKTLLSLALMDIKDSKLYNITVIKQDENENKMAIPTIIPLAINNLDFEIVNENEINFNNKINIDNQNDFDPSELANSSDFENEEDGF